jgi:antitoxin ParD1/3/4
MRMTRVFHWFVTQQYEKICIRCRSGVYLHQEQNIMTRQSISFTKPNDDWLKAQVNNEEYTSKSELINDLIRQARKQQVQVDFIRAKLDKSESSGFTEDTKDQILEQSKSLLNGQI